MSLSYLEPEFTKGRLVFKRRLDESLHRAMQMKADIRSAVHEVTSSRHARSAAMRVTSAMAVSFVLVQLARHFLA